MKKLKRWIPHRSQLENQRGLVWLKPLMARSYLWQWSRPRVAMGMAIGVFFAFIIPVFQILAATIAAIFLRGNVPVAALATFITTPLTFPAVFYAQYLTGQWVLELFSSTVTSPQAPMATPSINADIWSNIWSNLADKEALWESLGMPLVIGMILFAVIGGLVAYALVQGIWLFTLMRKLKRRKINGKFDYP